MCNFTYPGGKIRFPPPVFFFVGKSGSFFGSFFECRVQNLIKGALVSKIICAVFINHNTFFFGNVACWIRFRCPIFPLSKFCTLN